MKYDDIYYRWTQARSEIDVSPDFSNRVMNQVQFGPSPARRFTCQWSRLIERISTSTWAQAAAMAVAAILGIGRVLLTLHLLLSV